MKCYRRVLLTNSGCQSLITIFKTLLHEQQTVVIVLSLGTLCYYIRAADLKSARIDQQKT